MQAAAEQAHLDGLCKATLLAIVNSGDTVWLPLSYSPGAALPALASFCEQLGLVSENIFEQSLYHGKSVGVRFRPTADLLQLAKSCIRHLR